MTTLQEALAKKNDELEAVFMSFCQMYREVDGVEDRALAKKVGVSYRRIMRTLVDMMVQHPE